MNKDKGSILLNLFIVLLLISAGLGAYIFFIKNKPHIDKRTKKVKITKVETLRLEKTTGNIVVDSMGEVTPAVEVSLNPLVSGEVIFVSKNFYPGGIIKKGQILYKIDPRDYEIKVEKAKSSLKKAQASLDLEMGNQESARIELELYEQTEDILPFENKALALRKPYLDKADADLATAASDLRQAELNLSRTIVKAPFNGIIVETSVNKGSYISPNQETAALYGTDKYRIKALVPVDSLSNIDFRSKTRVDILSQTSGAKRIGFIKSLTGKIHENSRMAEVLVEIEDPLGIKSKKQPLIVNDYVSMDIFCKTIEGIISIPREYIHNGSQVFIFKNGKLEIREIEALWKNEKNILVKKGVQPGEELITSNISIPVNNMPLKKEVR